MDNLINQLKQRAFKQAREQSKDHIFTYLVIEQIDKKEDDVFLDWFLVAWGGKNNYVFSNDIDLRNYKPIKAYKDGRALRKVPEVKGGWRI